MANKDFFLGYKIFNQLGFLLLDLTSPQDSLNEIQALQKYFGKVVFHNRSDANGISLIKPMAGFSDYFGTTHGYTGLHTDGACSSQSPPKIVILQCEIPATKGGESQLLSCKLLYDYMMQFYPEFLDSLFRPNTFTITRANQSTKRAVFSNKNGKIFTIFRANGTAKISVANESSKAFHIVKEFTSDRKNILEFKLKKNQILVIDNTAVMHGRSAFSENSERQLNRIFLDGNINKPDQLKFGFNNN